VALCTLASARAAETPSLISAQRIREDVRNLSSDAFLGRGPGQAGRMDRGFRTFR
jgi:hypothetical protein